ncbi:MAG: hypothetical protein Q9219_003459 [cf. Caloplaca sp. 3 TL-2023]
MRYQCFSFPFLKASQSVPHITLDTTLESLYAHDNHGKHKTRMAMVLGGASSDVPLGQNFERQTKSLYLDRTFTTTPGHISSQRREEIQRDVAIKYLLVLPQRDAFVMGKMPVIMFNGVGPESYAASSKEGARKTLRALQKGQRPKLVFLDGPRLISTKKIGIDVLASKLVLDGLEGLPLTVDLETIYFLNSKAALCTSGLPTPKSVLLELEDLCVDPTACCSTCRLAKEDILIPLDCTGSRRPWLGTQISRIFSWLSGQNIPFVLKLQQTFGGAGTFMVTSPEDLSNIKREFTDIILPKLLPQVTSSNARLKPATLIASELIKDPIGDWGLTFFLTKTGRCIFLAVTEQIIDSTQSWIGSTISYKAQEKLKEKFTPLMDKIGSWLHSHGYLGPCGADILESEESEAPNTFNIVDLNVRITGSLPLGLMKGHFSERRRLHEASSFAVTTRMTRASFIGRFKDKIQQGNIIIASWYEDPISGVSCGSLVVGARDRAALEIEVVAIKDVTSDVQF